MVFCLCILVARICCPMLVVFFFFNDTATTEIYTLSLPRRSSDLPLVQGSEQDFAKLTSFCEHPTELLLAFASALGIFVAYHLRHVLLLIYVSALFAVVIGPVKIGRAHV